MITTSMTEHELLLYEKQQSKKKKTHRVEDQIRKKNTHRKKRGAKS